MSSSSGGSERYEEIARRHMFAGVEPGEALLLAVCKDPQSHGLPGDHVALVDACFPAGYLDSLVARAVKEQIAKLLKDPKKKGDVQMIPC
jgi:hypothetical protein